VNFTPLKEGAPDHFYGVFMHAYMLSNCPIAQFGPHLQRHFNRVPLVGIRPAQPMLLIGRHTGPYCILETALMDIATNRSLVRLKVRMDPVEPIRRPYIRSIAVNINWRQFFPSLDKFGQFHHVLIADPLPALHAAISPDFLNQ
jgi:hypothetical protein